MSFKPYEKEIIDSLYDAFLYTTGIILYGMLGKNALGFTKPCGKLDTDDVLKLTGYTALSIMTVDYMKLKKWIPPSIAPK